MPPDLNMGSIRAASALGKEPFFEILSHIQSGNGPRLARLSLEGRNQINTPNFFAISSRGVLPHLTPDAISAHTQVRGVHMALEDFMERHAPPVINSPGASPLHTFTALPSPLVTVLAPRRTPAVSPPNGNSNTAISIFTSTGFQVLSNKSYISYIDALRPDIAISLADIPYGTPPGTKRVGKMADRTQEWLGDLMNEKIDGQIVFAPVLPVEYLDQSEYLNYIADDLAEEISGLAFYDSNLLPDVPSTTSMSKLPRISLDEPTSPRQILRQVSLGMDIFTVPFIGFATDAGIALTFSFPRPLSDEASTLSNGSDALPLGVDMWSASHATSLLPLSNLCTCYTCTSHHKAFIQHLLSAREMLGWVLLQTHNHHILSEYFTSIRKSITEGTFEADCQEFERIYESELPENSGQGPRVRGYHSKSEVGQGKKNKPAWGRLEVVVQKSSGELTPDELAAELEEKGFAQKVET